MPPDLAIADAAARLSALHRLRTPDALRVATAIRSGATALLTTALLATGAQLTRVADLEVGLLENLR